MEFFLSGGDLSCDIKHSSALENGFRELQPGNFGAPWVASDALWRSGRGPGGPSAAMAEEGLDRLLEASRVGSPARRAAYPRLRGMPLR